ncbi:hypothetical protein [Kribbella shirazensis]|uniref:Uncharacterized protein n=1 Tax=Kribbella shirazensis TaxID=1105143 RepID=A0A7X6A2V7_9ACTN|nr:hypothetical protein [Kribbella shirazensis]NIK59345.1 hypothetical protein [Kribbella shirazensis]
MNNLLKDTLAERAAGVEPPPLDLDSIVAAGNRRISRRRAIGVLGGAVAAAAVTIGTATVVRPRDTQPQPAKPAPFAQRRVTYALGSTIHYGDEPISVAPHKVTAFVQTDAGFVFLDADNNIHAADRSGVRSLGKSSWELTADFRGTLVGWVEGFADHNESVVYDVAAGRELVRTAVGNKIPPYASLAFRSRIIAIDGGTAYFDTVDGPYRWDIRANRGELLAKVGTNVVREVAAGQIVFQQPLEQRPPAVDLTIAETVTAKPSVRFLGQQAFLSPTAAYLASQPNDARPGIQPLWAGLHLADTTSGKHVALPDRTYVSFYFGQWIDDETCTVAAEYPKMGFLDLLVVNARTGATKVAVSRFTTQGFPTTPPRLASFALPTGRPIIDLG